MQGTGDDDSKTESGVARRHVHPPRLLHTLVVAGLVITVAGFLVGAWQAVACGVGVVVVVVIAKHDKEGSAVCASVIAGLMALMLVGLIIAGAVWDRQPDSTDAQDNLVTWCKTSCPPTNATGNSTDVLCRGLLSGEVDCAQVTTFMCNTSFSVFLQCRQLYSDFSRESRNTNAHSAFLFMGHLMAVSVSLLGLASFLLSLEGDACLWHGLVRRLPSTARLVRCLGVDVSPI